MAEIRPGASPLTLALREFMRIDVVAFNRDGDIVLVECKLVMNRMSTRTALGQAVERASLLWGRPITNLDD